MVKIHSVKPDSPAFHAGIKAGEALLSINGHEICDILDYQFYETSARLSLELENGDRRIVSLRKGEYEPMGLEFETYLMDQQHSCRNQCVFCFIDQLPKGMRESLYFKDDDSRLSFLFGNYITLTNLSDHEIDRIISMKISPINVSVHTTNPELRVKMMGNRFAGTALETLRRFAEAGLKINCQLVLCPGINDGPELERSLQELGQLAPAVQSVAVVPVGLTKHRQGLSALKPYDRASAAAVLEIVERFGADFLHSHGERIAYAADEFYLCAKQPIPPAAFYGEFAQLENGVGLMASLKQEFYDALDGYEFPSGRRKVTTVTGEAAYDFINGLLDEVRNKCNNLTIETVAVRNDFFGDTINVTGLVTGGDILKQLRGKDLGDALLVPAVMLRHEGDIFLDDVSLKDLENELHTAVITVPNDGYELLDAVVGSEENCQNR